MPALATSPAPSSVRCPSCGDDLRWVWHVDRGRWVALDVEPNEKGIVICGPGDAAGLAMDIPVGVLLHWDIQRGSEETPRWRPHRERCGMTADPRRVGDSQNRWARGDSRGARPRAPEPATPVELEHVEPRPRSRCDACGSTVCTWATAADGTNVLLDAEPSLVGTLVWIAPADAEDRRIEYAGYRRSVSDPRPRFTNHHLGCRRRFTRPSKQQLRRIGRGWNDPGSALDRLREAAERRGPGGTS